MVQQKGAKIWDRIESRWPAAVGGRHISFAVLQEQMQTFLADSSVDVQSFSHFGIVVGDIDAALMWLGELIDFGHREIKKDWVESYKVYVARTRLNATELELIAPAGKSFFAEFVRDHGEKLHHLSFQVADIDNCLEALGARRVDLVDKKARSGSHGKVGFLKPREFEPLYLELCQLMDKH